MPALSLYLFWTDPSGSAYNFGCDTTEGAGERHELFSVVKKAVDSEGKKHQNKVRAS